MTTFGLGSLTLDYTAGVTNPQSDAPSFPVLSTARLELRQLVESEAEALFRVYSDPSVVRYSDLFLASAEEARATIQQFTAAFLSGTGMRWGIHLKSTGALIGTVGFQSLFLTRAELAFELLPEHWNQGLLSEVMSLLLPFGVDVLGFHRIQAWTHCDNETSIHLLQKMGFHEEGRMARACYLSHRDEWIDIRVFAKLA
jgi:ribosomal-protein-alanine N-acetyltransferase